MGIKKNAKGRFIEGKRENDSPISAVQRKEQRRHDSEKSPQQNKREKIKGWESKLRINRLGEKEKVYSDLALFSKEKLLSGQRNWPHVKKEDGRNTREGRAGGRPRKVKMGDSTLLGFGGKRAVGRGGCAKPKKFWAVREARKKCRWTSSEKEESLGGEKRHVSSEGGRGRGT